MKLKIYSITCEWVNLYSLAEDGSSPMASGQAVASPRQEEEEEVALLVASYPLSTELPREFRPKLGQGIQ